MKRLAGQLLKILGAAALCALLGGGFGAAVMLAGAEGEEWDEGCRTGRFSDDFCPTADAQSGVPTMSGDGRHHKNP